MKKEVQLYLFKIRAQGILSRGKYLPSIMRGIITHACLDCGVFEVWTDQTVNTVEGDVHVRRLFFSDISCQRAKRSTSYVISRLREEIDVQTLMKQRFNSIGKIIASAYWTMKRIVYPKIE